MKKYNVFKILTIVILLSMVLSYFIPGSNLSYAGLEKGTIIPVTFANLFSNGITTVSALITTIIWVLVIGVFYFVLKKTGKYETLVENTASVFDTNRGLFVVITVFGLGLVTLFSGDLLAMLIFVPFLYDVLTKLGFSKLSSILATIGSVILGFSGSTYTYYINQYMSLTVKDNLTAKITIGLIGLVSIVAFILVFNKNKKLNGEIRKSTMKKMLPLYITFILLFVFVVLGFINWNAYFGFKGFETFLENLREAKVSGVSIFDAVFGATIVPFGQWQTYNLGVLVMFASILLSLIYRLKINDFFEAFGEGLKKAFPYAIIITLANLVLVNVYSSGIFYTISIAITGKTINLFTGSLTSMLSSIAYPDYGYSAQFTLTSLMGTTATGYQALFAITYQAIYSLFLLISPTSILLLFALYKTDTRYIDWIKYIGKYFLVLLLAYLLVIAIFLKGFNTPTIIFMLAILVVLAFIIVAFKSKKESKEIKEEPKKEVKKDNKKTNKK
jgi:uncharacterized ion transporter superfamily protein YfcC